MNQPHELRKTIGLWSATTIVIGSVIGSGIFMKRASMAAQLGSPYMILVVWVVAGIISMFGAMAFAELGTMFPETGGQYIYIKKCFGDFVAFIYGWCTIAVINTASIAAIAFVCAAYTGYLFPLPHFDIETERSIIFHIPMIGDIMPLQNFGVKTLAIIIIMALTLVNYISVRSGNAIQFVATLLKTFALLILVVGILFSGKGSVSNFITNSPGFHLTGLSLFAAFMAATTGAFMAYDGWNNLNMIAGEIKNPHRNITRSLLTGLLLCIIVYVLVTFAYLYVLPVDAVAVSPLVASDATEKVFGIIGGTIIAVLIVVSTFGATNINLLTNARIVFAMSKSKTFFSWAGKVHPEFKTPGNSVIILGGWSSVLVVSGSFDILADMFVFMSWIFYGLTVACVFILRKKMPHVKRPYKAFGYPVIPLIFILFTAIYIATTLFNDVSNYYNGRSPFINSIFGLLLTATGIPLYFYFKKKHGTIVAKEET
jgi:APA family basic amino acid/polyamine antiporter